jgi:hypothetical protein
MTEQRLNQKVKMWSVDEALTMELHLTQREYDNLKRFVVNGGVMILLDGNVFYPEKRNR